MVQESNHQKGNKIYVSLHEKDCYTIDTHVFK